MEAMPFEPADSTVESCSLSVEAKELKKVGSFVDAKYSTVKSNDCLDFETKSDVKIIYSNVDSKCLSTVEEKENIKSAASSCCLVINDEQLVLSEEHKLDCDIYRINYGERQQVLVNSDNTCYPRLTLCSALMDTSIAFKHAIILILRNVSVAIFCEPNGSFYFFEPMPHYNGRETVLNFNYIQALDFHFCRKSKFMKWFCHLTIPFVNLRWRTFLLCTWSHTTNKLRIVKIHNP